MKFLTILTHQHPARPRCFARCLESVANQTDHDVQHLILRPEVEPHDVIKVQGLIHHAGPQIEGRYVMTLPDDDRIRDRRFVANLKAVIGSDDVDMVICRMVYGESKICPPDSHWQIRKLEMGRIAGQNVIVKREIFDQTSLEWCRPIYEADFFYIQATHCLSKKVVWWDYLAVESQGKKGYNKGAPESQIKLRRGIGGLVR